MFSLAVMLRVITSPVVAQVVRVELSEAMLTALSVGAALSFKTAVLLDCVVEEALPETS
jgi:hypothetical protein